MKVKLIPMDVEKELNKLYTACRTCYNAGSPIDMYTEIDTIDEEKKIKLIQQVLRSGHESTIEHCNVSFLIEGMDRATSLQFARHRLVSRSEKSQRYVEFKNGNFGVVYPKSVLATRGAVELFDECIEKISRTYADLIDMGIPAEDARAVLPNATCTDMTVTMNLRELIHICNERLCSCAQHEIKQMATMMAKQVKEVFPFMEEFLVPKCGRLGYCNEPKRRSCGRKPLKADVLEAYKQLNNGEKNDK